MAIHARPEAHSQGTPSAVAFVLPINVEAWAEDTAQMQSLASQNELRKISTSPAIALDEPTKANEQARVDDAHSGDHVRREPMRRDSLQRREALLRGKEGSRRRIRWENDRLLNNPWAQPPLPSDWEVHPTHPRHNVPYCLAPLWDREMASRAEVEKNKQATQATRAQTEIENAGKVPRQLREKLKKTRAAKGLLKDLEEQVRLFIQSQDGKGKTQEQPDLDSEDDEIVFVGRNGHMQDLPPSPKFKDGLDDEDVETSRLVFDSFAKDQGASFGRWLVHSIASYYGLRTWSVTVGDPARREAYVGIPNELDSRGLTLPCLPRPLYGLV